MDTPRFTEREKAIDLALWRNHNYRYGETYGVLKSNTGEFVVVPMEGSAKEKKRQVRLPMDYSKMDYGHISKIAMDRDLLEHWEDIRGMFSTVHGETLRFILSAQVPLEKFLRYELACRGYDKDFRWVGFQKAEEIWLQ